MTTSIVRNVPTGHHVVRRRPRSRHPMVRALVVVLVVGLVLLFLSNFLWALSTSFKAPSDILSYPPSLVPLEPTFENYQRVLNGDFLRWMLNSTIVAVGTIVVVLGVSIPAAYGATRFKFRGQTAMLFIILVGMAIGQVATVVPFYFGASRLHLIDTYFVLILAYSIWLTPLSVWLLRGYFKTIPTELDEAAMLDGCTRLQALVRIILPLTRPAIATAAMIIFVYSWNEFILAVVLTDSNDMRTIPVGLHMFLSTYGVDWGGIMSATIITMIPILMLFLVLQRQFIEGLTAGTLGSR